METKKTNWLNWAIVGSILLACCCLLSCMVIFILLGTTSANQKARDTARKSAIGEVMMMIEEYYSDYGQYPAKSDFLVTKTH